MKYNGVIENKLRTIERKIQEIEEWRISSFQEFNDSSLLQNAVERALQVAVEAMIDVSERILSLKRLPPAESGASNLEALEKQGIIKDASSYKDMVRFRNFIVHRYERIDTEIVYGIIKNKLSLFSEFIHEIRSS